MNVFVTKYVQQMCQLNLYKLKPFPTISECIIRPTN